MGREAPQLERTKRTRPRARGLPAVATALAALALAGPLHATAELAPRGACRGAESSGASAAVQARAIHCLTNHVRRVARRPPLRRAPTLNRSTQVKNRWMARCRSFSHRACGRPFVVAFTIAGWQRAPRGENIALNLPRATPRATMRMWLASPLHRANILGPWRYHGVAMMRSMRMGWSEPVQLWTAHFAR